MLIDLFTYRFLRYKSCYKYYYDMNIIDLCNSNINYVMNGLSVELFMT